MKILSNVVYICAELLEVNVFLYGFDGKLRGGIRFSHGIVIVKLPSIFLIRMRRMKFSKD